MSTKRFSFSKGLMSIFVALMLVVTLFACNRDNTDELIAEALENLSIVFESGDSMDSVTQNLNLPTSIGDVTITWSSNNPAVISNLGVVTRGFSDVNVILTATATLNDITETKPFTVKVIGHDAVAALDSIVLAGANIAYNATTEVYTVTGNITLPALANGLAITWESLLPAVLSEAGVVVRPVYGEENANVILIAKIGTQEREFNILVPAITDKPVSVILAEARTALLIPGVSDGVSQNITLPMTVTRPEGAVTVTWSSSNPDVISNTGVVNRQEDQVNVTLTATLTYQSQSVTKDFDLVVLPSVAYVVAENIADAIELSRDGTSYTRNYVRINAVTVLGITGDGVVLIDDSGIIFVYMAQRLTTVVVGGVYDVRGTTDRYFGAWQLNHLAVSGQPVIFTASTEAAYVPTPVAASSVTAMLANHPVPTPTEPEINYVYYRLTAKVRVQNALDNYGTILVDPEYAGGNVPADPGSAHTTDGVVIYYHSNRTALHPYDGLTVTMDILFYGYRSDRSIFNMLFLGTVEDITTTLDDAGILNVVETTLRGQIAADYIEPTTITLPTMLLGSTVAWTSSHDDLINPNTGVVTLPAVGQTEVTLTAVLTRGEATKTITIKVNVGELEISTIAQALALPAPTKVRVFGVVTGILANRTFMIEDQTGAIAVFVLSADVATWFGYVGKTIELIGTRGAFGGLEQINPLLVIVGDVTPIPFPVNIDGIPLTATDLLPYQAKSVIRTNLVVDSLPAQSFGNVLAVLKDPVTNETISFFWDSRIVVDGGNIGTLQVGDVISLIGVPLTWTSNLPRFAYTNASQIYMGIYVDLDDAGKAEAAANALPMPLEVQAGITLTLPVAGQFDSTIVWTSSDDTVINPTTGVVTLPLTGNVTITLTATVTVNDAEFVKEFNIVVGEIVKTVAVARALLVNEIITVEAVVMVVTIGTNISAFIQDETGGINVFISSATQTQKDAFVVGNKILISGKIGFFNNQIQIAAPTKVEQISTGNPVVPIVVDDIEDLILHEGKLVTITVLLKDAGGVRSTNIIDLTGEVVAYFNTNGDQAVLNGIAAGTWVTITGPVGRRFENIQFLIYTQAAVTVGLLGTDAELGAVAATKFVAPEANNAVIADLTLPTTGLFGTVVTWTSSNPAVISNAGVVTRPLSTEADATVTLSYELKKGDFVAASGDVVFVVLKEEPANGGDPVPVTVTAAYPGGTTTNMAASPANNATLIGLDPVLFTVTSLLGAASVEVGLNTAGQIRIYANRTNGNGNTLTITAAAGYKITGVEFVFGASTNSPTATLMLGEASNDLLAADLLNITKTYTDLNISSFSLKNTQNTGGSGSNAQIFILQIIITYVAE